MNFNVENNPIKNGYLGSTEKVNFSSNPYNSGSKKLPYDTFEKQGAKAAPDFNFNISRITPEAARVLFNINPSAFLHSMLNKDIIAYAVKQNPNIKKILMNNNMPLIINPRNVDGIVTAHINPATDYAVAIAKDMNLPDSQIQVIKKGLLLHDYGKVLIPSQILTNKDELTKQERKIINLHSELGAELLQTIGIEDEVTEIVRNHHAPLSKNPSLNAQIARVADVYSALREDRSYHKSFSPKTSFKILNKMAAEGKVDGDIVKRLGKIVQEQGDVQAAA